MEIEKTNILNINIDRANLDDILLKVEKLLDKKFRFYICVPNSYLTVVANQDKKLLNVLNNAEIVIPDGAPLVWYSKTFKKSLQERITGFDFFYNVSKVADKKKYSYFFMGGGNEEILEKIKTKLGQEFKNIKVLGYYCPPFMETFTDEINNEIIKIVNKYKPDILWVGLSAPKQERWIYKNINKLNVKMACGIGAVFNFYIGYVKRAPLWVQKIGLEWFYRMIVEPKRLLKKYLVYNTKFILLVAKDILRRIFRLK